MEERPKRKRPTPRDRVKRWLIAAVAGAAVGAACRLLPPEMQVVCAPIVKVILTLLGG